MDEGWKRREIMGLMCGTTGALVCGVGGWSAVAEAAVSGALARQMAPSGRLRAAINVGNVVLARKGGPLGATGISVDIAGEMARRLKVPLDLVVYDTAGKVVTQLGQDHWDVAFMGIDPGRADEIAFTRPYVIIEGTYLVREDAPYRVVADLDRSGVRVAVGGGTAYDLYLSRALKQAQVVRFPTSPQAIEHFTGDRLEAAAGIRQALVEASGTLKGYRVLPDSFNRIEQAVAIPKGRAEALHFAQTLLDELKRSGGLRASLLRNGQDASLVAS